MGRLPPSLSHPAAHDPGWRLEGGRAAELNAAELSSPSGRTPAMIGARARAGGSGGGGLHAPLPASASACPRKESSPRELELSASNPLRFATVHAGACLAGARGR